jgi:hypothetical protein
MYLQLALFAFVIGGNHCRVAVGRGIVQAVVLLIVVVANFPARLGLWPL